MVVGDGWGPGNSRANFRGKGFGVLVTSSTSSLQFWIEDIEMYERITTYESLALRCPG